MKQLIVWIDSGDTLIDEGSEYRRAGSPIVERAEMVPGAKEVLETLKKKGYRIALVADGYVQSFDQVYRQHGLEDIFEVRVISETVGVCKPEQEMFQTALKKMGLTENDKFRIVMIGNNLKRDILGANRFGIRSVLLSWTPRYCMRPESKEEEADYTISDIRLLPDLLERIEGCLVS